MMLSSKHLQAFIVRNKLKAEIVKPNRPTPTVCSAAEAMQVEPINIVKTVLFLADKAPVVVIAAGLTRVDRKKLADYLSVARRRVKIARPDQVLKYTGYVAGAVPPFGFEENIRTVVDKALINLDIVYAGGGDINSLLRINTTELLSVVGQEVTNLAEK